MDFRGFPFPVVEPYFSMDISRMANLTKKVQYLVFHHTGGRHHDASAAHINRVHIERGWAGIGYHFVIRWDGTLEIGRPLHKQGSHTAGYNDVSLGVVMSGNFEEGEPTEEQLRCGVALARLIGRNYPDIEYVRHKDIGRATLCNGKNFPWEQFIRDVESDNMALRHIVVQGDRLGRIATAHNLTLEQTMKYNPHITDANLIHVGDIVYLSEPSQVEKELAALNRRYILKEDEALRKELEFCREQYALVASALNIANNTIDKKRLYISDLEARLDKIRAASNYK